MLWVFISLGAALAQTLRFMVQKRLRLTTLSSAGATYARFIYAGPLILALGFGYAFVQGGLPQITPRFWIFVTGGGAAQIGATMALVTLFATRHFTVGIALAKIEVLFTAILGYMMLGDGISTWAGAAMGVGIVAVILLSAKGPSQLGSVRDMGLGLLAGILFGLCSVLYRAASMQVLSPDAFLRGTQTLMWAIVLQTVMMTAYLALREKGQITQVIRSWRVAAWIGGLSLIGSVGWFWAFALQSAAYVKAVGQIEVAFSLIIAALVFQDRLTLREGMGIALMVASVLGLILVV